MIQRALIMYFLAMFLLAITLSIPNPSTEYSTWTNMTWPNITWPKLETSNIPASEPTYASSHLMQKALCDKIMIYNLTNASYNNIFCKYDSTLKKCICIEGVE